MKKSVFLFVTFLVSGMLSAQTRYTIKGDVPLSNTATKVVMSYPPDDKGGEYKSDTTYIKDGKFLFTGTIGRPQLAEINFIRPVNIDKNANTRDEPHDNMKDVGLLYLDGEISISFDKTGKASYEGGGREQVGWRDYERMTMAKTKSEPEKLAGMKFFEELITDFVKTHPDLYVSVDLMDLFTQSSIQPDLVEPMYQSLSKRMQNSEKVLGWVGKLDQAKLAVSGTQIAPLFTLNDADGTPIALESYRGGYVLVDFWASWCVPCRQENPNLLAAYEKYKHKDFSVLAVSLDTKKDLWLKAISEDRLPWKQVCDFKANNSEVSKLYDISSIPANVLVDPKGYIIAKDLRGDALNDKLAEIYGK